LKAEIAKVEAVSVVETVIHRPADRLIVTCGLALATALQAADALIANVALPKLESDLGGGIELGAWVITSYLCATAVVAPLTGWLRRYYGPRRLFFAAIGGFVIGSLLCALATTANTIIFFRILQGAGGGIIHPLAQAILLDLYPKARHGKIMAIWGAALMVGPILGPVVGGVITDLASWRWVFVINLPLGLIAIWCVWPLRSRAETKPERRIDLIAILLLMMGVAALQLCLERGASRSWLSSPEIISEAVIAALAFGLLAVRSRNSGFTAFRPEMFKDVNFSTAAFYNFMNSALLFVAVVFLPLLSQGPLGLSATIAGAMIVPRAVLLMLVMLFTGQLIGRINYRVLLGTGWVLAATGLMILSTIQPNDGLTLIIIGSLIQSLGAGILYIPLATLAFSTLSPEIRTDATGLYSLLRQLGYASGVALMTAILQAKTVAHLAPIAGETPLAPDLASLKSYGECFRLMAFVAIAVIPGIFLFRTPKRQAMNETT
jgi:MFS transporter, DHA2 family, multidrug resistance protein